MTDQKAYLGLYAKHKIKDRYGVSFQNFVYDLGTKALQRPSVEDKIRELVRIYEADKRKKSDLLD